MHIYGRVRVGVDEQRVMAPLTLLFSNTTYSPAYALKSGQRTFVFVIHCSSIRMIQPRQRGIITLPSSDFKQAMSPLPVEPVLRCSMDVCGRVSSCAYLSYRPTHLNSGQEHLAATLHSLSCWFSSKRCCVLGVSVSRDVSFPNRIRTRRHTVEAFSLCSRHQCRRSLYSNDDEANSSLWMPLILPSLLAILRRPSGAPAVMALLWA